MGIAYPNPPSFSFDAKENEAKENFTLRFSSYISGLLRFLSKAFNARNSGLKPLKQDGLTLNSKPKYYGAFANGRPTERGDFKGESPLTVSTLWDFSFSFF
ncbi:MAG TPA: hypothetical protein DDW90_02465 [Cyanobacteria bacterium UBA9971]|nr:hypothetical protein [Cyanobacteria bacterium UBA9971]